MSESQATKNRELREVRLAVAGWVAGLPEGAAFALLVTGGNPYVFLALLLSGFVLWETLRRSAGWLR